jgi:hypothetical protein
MTTLDCKQCIFIKGNGQRCKRRTCVRKDYCWQHLRSQKGVDVRPSTLPGAGLGLFAYKTFRPKEKSLTILARSSVRAKLREVSTRLRGNGGSGLMPRALKIRSAGMPIHVEVLTKNRSAVKETMSRSNATFGAARLY